MKKAITLITVLCLAALLFVGCNAQPEVPAEHTHTLVHNEGKAPTCVNNGIKEHWYCPDCNARFSDAEATTEVTFADLEVEELGHTKGADDGDCTTAIDCTVCGKIAVAAKAHTPAEDDGDCTTAVECTECEKNAVEANEAHDFTGVFNADSTQHWHICANDGCEVIDEKVDHKATDDGDCTTDNKCDTCNWTVVEAGHSWTDVEAKAATCTEDGYTAHKACTCGATEGKEVIPAGHSWTDVEAKAATCTEDGYTAHKACTCGATEGKEVIPAGHSWTDVEAKAATCTEGGYTAHKACSACGEIEGKTELPVADHSYVSGICDRCGILNTPAVEGSFAEDAATKVGHYNGPWEKPASFTDGFYTWQQDGFAPRFTVESYADASLGKYLKLDVTSEAGLAGHLVLDYFVSGLTADKQYELVLYVKATDGINFSHIQLRKEHSYGTVTVPTEVKFTEFSNEWTKVTLSFTANPNADGICAIAIDFYPAEGAVDGSIYLDGIHTEEVETPKTPVAYYNGPWEFGSTAEEYFVSWAYGGAPAKNIYVYEDDGSIYGEIENVSATANGAGYLLDYWVSGLTAGKTYEMKIRYKNTLVNGSFNVENEGNGGGTVTIDGGAVTLASASDWTEATIRFTAAETTATHWSFRFALYVSKDASALTSGAIALDVVSIEEYVAPVVNYAEDAITSVLAAAPWDVSNSTTFKGGFRTWTQSSNVPVFSVEELAEGDNAIKVDVNGKTGGINMDWYISGLTDNQKYTISFLVKASEDINWGSIVLRNEHSYGHGAVAAEVTFSAFSTEWTKVEVTFTAANDTTRGLSALCFDFRAPSDSEGVGTIWIDQIIATPVG